MIRYENISVTFRGEDLFGNLNLEIPCNSKTLITGKSGYGKSTLFSILLGFFLPQKGKVYFNNRPITPESAWNVRTEIAYVDQEASLGQGKVSEWFAFVASLKANRALNFSKENILEKFSLFDLPEEIYDEDIAQISGGEKQRLALVTAVLLKRKVFLLDEPTAALDEKLKGKVIDYFMNLNDVTVVVVSHDEIWKKPKNIKIYDMERKQWVR